MRAEAAGARLRVWVDGQDAAIEFPWFWVRDHSEDPASLDPDNLQRSVDTFAIDPAIQPSSVELIDGTIHVAWPDGQPISLLGPSTLAWCLPPAPATRTLWRDADSLDVRPHEWSAVMADHEALGAWLIDIDTHGFGRLAGAPTDAAAATALADRLGYVRHTIFGGTWTLSSEVTAHADSAYGADTLLPHTDGSYSHDGPGLQFFVCSERTGTGGESVLVDGFAAAAALAASDPDAFAVLSEVEVPGRYVEDGVYLVARRPTIRLDGNGDVQQITLNNYDRAPFVLPEPTLSKWYRAYAALHELVREESSWWTTRLEPGDVLLFDNWRCLHGRLAYTGCRVFHGAYLNHEDFESRLRTAVGAS